MKIVKNTSQQGFNVAFETPNGTKYLFVGPKAFVNVPDTWGGRVINNLVSRRQFKVTHVSDPVKPIVKPVKKSLRKKTSNLNPDTE
jgi:hypothetical protein